jgi:hypothetical protein
LVTVPTFVKGLPAAGLVLGKVKLNARTSENASGGLSHFRMKLLDETGYEKVGLQVMSLLFSAIVFRP